MKPRARVRAIRVQYRVMHRLRLQKHELNLNFIIVHQTVRTVRGLMRLDATTGMIDGAQLHARTTAGSTGRDHDGWQEQRRWAMASFFLRRPAGRCVPSMSPDFSYTYIVPYRISHGGWGKRNHHMAHFSPSSP